MNDLTAAMLTAVQLVAGLDADLLEIVSLSLQTNFLALAVVLAPAILAGAFLGVWRRFRTHGFWVSLLNAMMGLPPVVVGLLIYLLLSNSGPLASLELLYTPTAMVIAQAVLIFPIVASLTHQTVSDYYDVLNKQLRALGCGGVAVMTTLLYEARFSLITAVLAGLGRALAEVGAVLIVGGNIYHVTRVMTTAITLETGKGNLALALALGMILIALSFFLSFVAGLVRRRGRMQAEI